jgi:hypothetical protein
MKKTLFLKTESGIIVVPKLEHSSWWYRWKHDRWLKIYFKTKVQKSATKPWKILSSMYEVKILIEENNNYRVEEHDEQI